MVLAALFVVFDECRYYIWLFYAFLEKTYLDNFQEIVGQILTTMRALKSLSENLSALNQRATFYTGINTKATLRSQSAGLKTLRRDYEECIYTTASIQSRFFIIPKSLPNPKSPMQLKENQEINLFMGTACIPSLLIISSRFSAC